VAREVEDIAALLRLAGGTAFVWGMSSGGVLALEAASRLSGIKKVAVYEAPLIVNDGRPSTGDLAFSHTTKDPAIAGPFNCMALEVFSCYDITYFVMCSIQLDTI